LLQNIDAMHPPPLKADNFDPIEI